MLSIYNGFPYHYEMFAHILHWCEQNNMDCTIYTNTHDDFGWLNYYQERYSFIQYEICANFIRNAHLYHIIILIADNDTSFDRKWLSGFNISRKIIKLNHSQKPRYPEIERSIDIRKFNDTTHYAYGVSNIINSIEKEQLIDKSTINIFVDASGYHYDINNLKILDAYPNTILHFIARKIDARFTVNFKCTNQYHENTDIKHIISIICKCQYMFYGLNDESKFRHETMSSLLNLSYSCCTPVIMDATTYLTYNYPAAVVYKDDIFDIFKNIDYKVIESERSNMYLALDHRIKEYRPKLFNRMPCDTGEYLIPREINFMWLSKTTNEMPNKHDKHIKTFKQYNPDYHIKFWNLDNTRDTIKEHLPEFYESFMEAQPWISKCDFARFCIIYIYGGIYSDLDFYCNRNLDSLIINKDHIFAYEPIQHGKDYLYNGFFAAAPKSEFIYGWLETMAARITSLHDVLFKTGPIGLGVYYNSLQNRPQITETYKIILYDGKHRVDDNIGDINNIDDNYVYTLWTEGSCWGFGVYFRLYAYPAFVMITVIIILILIYVVLKYLNGY